jgi:glycosyltransferase involved in cell wall biosynthesis
MQSYNHKKKLRVDLIYSGWLNAPNGVSTFIRTFMDGTAFFSEHAISLFIFSSDIFQKRDFESKSKRVNGILKTFLKSIIPHSKYLTAYYLQFIERRHKKIIDQYLQSGNTSEVLFFNELLTCYHYLKSTNSKQVKLVLVLHSNGDTFKMLNSYYPKLKLTKYYQNLLKIEEEVINRVDRIGFVSKFSMNLYMELHPHFDKSKLFFIYNGLGNTCLRRQYLPHHGSKTKYNFCCVGSITKRKGQELIIHAFNKLSLKEKENFQIIFLGEGDQKVQLVSLVQKLRLDKYLKFKGSVNNIDDYLTRSDVFILTSYDEGLPIAIIEALRHGLPIISTKVGGIPEMVDNYYNGILIEPFEDDLLNVFKNMDSYDLELFGLNSIKVFQKKFTQDAMFSNYIDIFWNV